MLGLEGQAVWPSTLSVAECFRVVANVLRRCLVLQDMLLWNYLEVRGERRGDWMMGLDVEDLLDLQDMGLFDGDTDLDDDSDYSDYEHLLEV